MTEPGVHLHHAERLGGELAPVTDRTMAAWSAPRTWVAGEVLTASLLNVHLRDQLLYLGGVDQRLSSPPGAPIDGQLWRYVADATTGIEWLFAYNSGDAGAFKWHKIGGPPLRSIVSTRESTATASFVALTTPGPTITVPRGGDYHVIVEYHGDQSANGASQMSFDVGGTGAIDADSAGATTYQNVSSTVPAACVFRAYKTGIAAATTLTAKYKAGVGTQFFADRTLMAEPTRVS